MSDEMVEFVVASDCGVDGEAFLRGEVRSVSKGTYRQLVAAGRVCKDPELAEQLKAERAKLDAPSSSGDDAAKEAAARAAKDAAETAAREAAELAAKEAAAKADAAKGAKGKA